MHSEETRLASYVRFPSCTKTGGLQTAPSSTAPRIGRGAQLGQSMKISNGDTARVLVSNSI